MSIDFLKKLFLGIGVRCVHSAGVKRYNLYVKIRDNYLCSILRMTCLFNEFDFPLYDDNEAFVDYLTNNRQLESYQMIDFEQIEKDGVSELALENLEWIREQVVFAMEVLDEYGIDKTGNKRKVSSIIDSL